MATPLNTMFKRGYSSVYYLMIEGIPYTFTERQPLRVDDDSTATAAAGRTTVNGLVVDQSSLISMEIDRPAGVGRGAAVTFLLAYKDLENAGVLNQLFARPALQTEITADVTATATSMTADTTGFASSGAVYFGREYITYTGTGAAFTGCTRGVVGYPYKHEASSVSHSRFISDKPLIWRGRFVTLYESICDREGRMVDSQWGAGDYTREIWKGYIEAPPAPSAIGMELECLPLCRLMANEIGFGVKWEDDRLHYPFPAENVTGAPFPAFYDDGTGYITLKIKWTGTTTGTASGDFTINVHQDLKRYFSSPELWCKLLGQKIQDDVTASLLPEFRFMMTNLLEPWSDVGFKVYFAATGSVTVTGLELTVAPATAPYFLNPQYKTADQTDFFGRYVPFPFKTALNGKQDFPYLIVQKLTGQASQDFDVIVPGIGVLTNGNISEIVRWDAVVDADTFTGKIGIRLSERGVGGSPIAGILEEGFTLEAAVGSTGTLEENILTILESSGSAGVRGASDTLPLGFGLGVPESMIDTTALGKMHLGYFSAPIVKNKKATAASLVGGWVAAAGYCLVNYRDGDTNTISLKPVETDLGLFTSKENNVEALTTADVLLNRLEPAKVVDPPNPVTIDTSCMLNDGAKLTVRDSVAVQEQGAHDVELRCPGMPLETAKTAATNFIYQGSGQYAVTLGVGPWVNVQAGDKVILDLTHPGIYDWNAGAAGASSVAGRVVGWSRDLVTNEQSLTVLLNGVGKSANLLCPVGVVASKAGDAVTLTSGVEWFTAGESVILYNRGEEALGTPEIETLVIDTISGNDVTFTTTPAAWVAANTRITYPNLSAASAAQDDFFFRSDLYKWSG